MSQSRNHNGNLGVNADKGITYENLSNVTKRTLRGKYIVLSVCIREK